MSYSEGRVSLRVDHCDLKGAIAPRELRKLILNQCDSIAVLTQVSEVDFAQLRIAV